MATPLTHELREAILDQERFVSDLLKTRSGTKRWWESPFITSALVAVLTATLTSVFGYQVQRSVQTFQLRMQRDEAESSLRRATMQGIVAQATGLVKANEDRVDLARGKYDALSNEQIAGIVQNTNDVGRLWRRQQDSVGFVVSLLFSNGGEPPPEWHSMLRAMERFTVCSSVVPRQYQGRHAPDTSCAQSRTAALDSLHRLSTTLMQQSQLLARR